MTVSSSRITLHFDVHEPIELMELTLSFGVLARQYRQFLVEKMRMDGRKVDDDDVKLYITKIENNCILAELAGAVNILGGLYTVMDCANIFFEFISKTNDIISFFKGLAKQKKAMLAKDIPYSKKMCGDMANFLKVVSKNKGGNLKLGVTEFASRYPDGKKVLASFTFTSEEAFEAQKGALVAQRVLDDKGSADHANVLMYFYQTNVEQSKSEGKTAELAIIKSISDKPLPVYFVSQLDGDRVKSLKDDPKINPFKASYRVDVDVETDRHDVPRFYRIVHLHEIIPDEP